MIGIQVTHEEHAGIDRLSGVMFIRLHTRAMAEEFVHTFHNTKLNARTLLCDYARREMTTPYRRSDRELEIGKARFLEDVWNISAEDIRRQAIQAERLRRQQEAAAEAAALAASMQP